jgi:hypothetical protein
MILFKGISLNPCRPGELAFRAWVPYLNEFGAPGVSSVMSAPVIGMWRIRTLFQLPAGMRQNPP